MKHLFFILLSILFSSYIKAQSNYQEVVYLKNGSIIRGIIIEQIPNVALKIQTADKSVWVYEFDEIEKIAKEEIPAEKKAYTEKEKFEIKEKGFASTIRGGLFGNTNGIYFSATASMGYQFSKKYSLTLGAGIFQGKNSFVPVFLMNRINFLDGRITPTLGVEAGYIYIPSSSIDRNNFYNQTSYYYYNYYNQRGYDDSVYLNPSVGLKLRMSKNSSWVFDFGYRYWNISNSSINMLSFQTGVEF